MAAEIMSVYIYTVTYWRQLRKQIVLTGNAQGKNVFFSKKLCGWALFFIYLGLKTFLKEEEEK